MAGSELFDMTSAGPWTLVESYSDTAARAYLAGLVLKEAGDPATSGHLFGVAAECAVKHTLELGGIVIDRSLKVHFPHLSTAIAQHGQGRHMLAILTLLTGPPMPLGDYTIHTRYAKDGNIDDLLASAWQADAEGVFLALGVAL
jgi:hypothetical protein